MIIRIRPPIAFIAVIMAMWIGVRWIALIAGPVPSSESAPAVQLASAPPLTAMSTRAAIATPVAINPIGNAIDRGAPSQFLSAAGGHSPTNPQPANAPAIGNMITSNDAARSETEQRRASMRLVPVATAPDIGGLRPRNLSIALWAQWRPDVGFDSLANAGELGGSQAGTRLSFRIWQAGSVDFALAARLSRPIERSDGAEAALGVAVQPFESLPLTVSLDRRIAIEAGARNAWSIGVAGGVYRKAVTTGLELDGYAQAGIVGAHSRDLYVDGSASLSHPIAISERAILSLGVGAWGGAQPGVARVDIGPEAGLRLPLGDMGIRLALGWRHRIAGSAEPGSGPALTLGADF